MKYLVHLPNIGSPAGVADVGTLVDAAQVLEKVGFDACSVTDHPFPLLSEGSPGHQSWDPFVLLSAISQATDSLRLVTCIVVLPYRNPFVVASSANTLDHVSSGRLVLGVASGYLEGEFDALGSSFRDRGALMDEGLAAMKAAWSGEPVHRQSDRWVARGNTLQPTPLTVPHPPVWMGGNSKQAMRRAIEHCQGWMPSTRFAGERAHRVLTASMGTLADLAARLRVFREMEERQQRDVPLDVCVCIDLAGGGTTPEQALEHVGRVAALGVDWIGFRIDASSKAELLDAYEAWGAVLCTPPARPSGDRNLPLPPALPGAHVGNQCPAATRGQVFTNTDSRRETH